MKVLELLTTGLIPAFLVINLLYRYKPYDGGRFWRLRGLGVTVATFYWSGYVAFFWGNVLGDFHLIDGSRLGIGGGAVVGVLVYELAHYWYHRAAHQYDWLWRLGHQMHHSAESLDAFGAYYLHPVDAAMFASLSSLVFFPLLGLAPEAGVIGAMFLTFNAMFQHANVKTPRWLGYLVQRPESHSVHHGRGIHRFNYSDLPLWDIAFGTFRNPEEFQPEQGFYQGASARIVDMLLFRDVTRANRAEEAERPEQRLAA
jgi:sterol desaturase/sphingolipid hydroxylase (fatty acid hydroxylase superfamily)